MFADVNFLFRKNGLMKGPKTQVNIICTTCYVCTSYTTTTIYYYCTIFINANNNAF